MSFDADLELALEISKKEAEEGERARAERQAARTAPGVIGIRFTPTLLAPSLRKNFSALYDTHKFSDIALVVVHNDSILMRIPSHRVVLCAWSETFRAMLENDTWRESHEKELVVKIDHVRELEHFRLLLKYIYTGEILVDITSCLGVLAIANYYGVLPLKEDCGAWLAQSINGDNVFQYLEAADKFNCVGLGVACGKYLAEHFAQLIDGPKLLNLDLTTWVEILKNDELQVRSEEHLFEAVVRYVEAKAGGDNYTRQSLFAKLLPYVRFPLMSGKYLVSQIEQNRAFKDIAILHQLLHETYRLRALPGAAAVGTLTAISKPRLGFRWEPDIAMPNMANVSEDRKTARIGSTSATSTTLGSLGIWRSARTSQPFTAGLTYIELVISATQCFVGVHATRAYTLATYVGATFDSWGLHSTGQLYHCGANSAFCAAIGSGDRIGIQFNVANGQLAFYRNGVRVGSTTQIPEPMRDSVFPAVSLNMWGDAVTITSRSAPPGDSGRGEETRNTLVNMVVPPVFDVDVETSADELGEEEDKEAELDEERPWKRRRVV